MQQAAHDPADILKENEALRARLEEAEALLSAIRSGPQGDSVLGQVDISDRRTADAALHVSEIRYRRLFEAAHDGVLILDPATRKIVDANPFMTALLGYRRDQLIGKELYEIGFLADAEASRDMFQTLTATRQVRYEDLPLRNQQGGLRDVEVVANLYDENGHSVVQCNVRDITERKAAETALREREDELSRAHRIAGIGSFKVEVRDGNFVADRSPEYLAVHGLTPQDRGNSHEAWLRRLHPEDREKADRTFRECLADGRKLYQSEYRIIRQNDSATRWIRVLAEIERDASGAPLRLFGTHLDVTESRLHEAALRTSEVRYRRLFEAAHDGILILDPDTRKIVDANPFMTALIGFSPEQLIGMELYEIGFLADAQASKDMFEKLKATRHVRYENLPLQTEQGGPREVEVVANLYDEGGHSVVQCNVRDITERKRIDTKLREHQNFLDHIFEVVPGVLYIFDLDENRAVFVNNPADQTYSPEEITGMGADMVPNLMHPEDHQGFQEHITRIRMLKPGETAVFEYRMRDKAGYWRWYMGTDTVFLGDEGGAVRQIIGVATEITDRKRAELALRESENRFRLALENSPVSVFEQDLDLRYTWVYNPKAGFEAHSVLGKTDAEVMDAAAAGPLTTIKRGVLETGQSAHREASLGAPGQALSHFELTVEPRHGRDGKINGIICSSVDITERKRAETALQASEHRHRTLIDATSAVTWSCAPSGLLVETQPQWAAFTGQSTSEMLGGGHAKAFHPDDTENARARWVDAVARDAPYQNELRIRRHDGEWRWMRVHCVPVHRDGVVDEWFGMCIDITERKRHEEHVLLLMGEVNHRSKNMLSVVQAIAKRTMATRPENFMERFGERLQALVANQDLLIKNEWKAVSLGELVRSQLAHFGDVLDTRVTLDGPPVEITASASQALGMALHELATNAAKYGALSIKSGRVIVSWSLLSDAAGKARFTLSWIESGGPLVAKPTRHGFGSTVTGAMIKMSLGCDAEVDFAPTGLVWRIDCPAAGLIEGSALSATRSNGAAPKEHPAEASGRRRVLVVEDEPLIAMDFAHALAEAGYDVIGPANSVATALALIARSGCDAAVLDINLGAETAEPVARELIRRGTPFIVTSGYMREQQPELMRTAPLLRKPLKPELLFAEIERCLSG